MSATAGMPVSLSPRTLGLLRAVVSCPGLLASDLADVRVADGRQVASMLRCLREAGLVQAEGPSPARWYPTGAGVRVASRQRLAMLRERSRRMLRQRIVMTARAEALYEFADTFTQPGQQRLLCPPPRHRSFCFGELVRTLRDSVGRYVLVFSETADTWPRAHPITAVGTIDSLEEDRGFPIDDWLVTLTVGGSAFVEFSRRRFQTAAEDRKYGELSVRQGAQTTTICFEPIFIM